MARTTKTLGCIAALAVVAAVTLPIAATAYAEPRENDKFDAVCDVDGTHLYDTDEHETQKRHASQVTEQLAQMRSAAAEAERAAREAEEAQAWSETANSDAYAPSDGLTKQGGINYHDGRLETYYPSTVLYHWRTPEWTADSEGFYRTAEGYYVVAASDLAEGTVFEGSKGTCIVLDSGCAAGTTDYYVDGRWA